MPHVHFIAIGGAGMSGIAKVLLEMGYVVSGSDLKETEGTRRLESMGASVFLGHSAGNLDQPDVVVVSSAVPEDNEELREARARSIPVVHRGEMLARLMEGRKGISVAGAHGKTTTTSMIAMVLEKGGLNPTVLVGGEVADFGGNAKLGAGEYLVAEADESDGSFLKLRPHIAVVTNVDDDHLDYYHNMDSLVAAFREYISNTAADGFSVLCFDDVRVRSLPSGDGRRHVSYGLEGPWDYTAAGIDLQAWTSSFDVLRRGERLGRMALGIPGAHNVVNSLAAVAVGIEIGLGFDAVREALAAFHGVQRRLQTIAEVGGVRVLDDYGHHPTEIATTLKVVRYATKGRMICVFQPHRYSRTLILREEFGSAFRLADHVILLEVYPGPGEKPIAGVSSQMIAESIRRRDGDKVSYIHEKDEAVRLAAAMAMPGDTIITVGAGDVWMLAPAIAAEIEDRVAGHGHAHPT